MNAEECIENLGPLTYIMCDRPLDFNFWFQVIVIGSVVLFGVIATVIWLVSLAVKRHKK